MIWLRYFKSSGEFAPIFARLLELPDPVVLEILAIVIGETLAAGSEAIEMIGQYLNVDMAKLWTPDAAFWGLVRDKEVLGKIVAEVAGDDVAAANAGQQAKVLKTIVVDHLDGANGRPKVGGWVPRWMHFAPSPYTARGGVASVAAHDRLLHILARAAEAEAVREVADTIVEADPDESTDPREGAVTEAEADAADEGDGADAGDDTALAA